MALRLIIIQANQICNASSHMAQAQEFRGGSKHETYDSYFEIVQSRKQLPKPIQEILTTAFADTPVSCFPGVPGGKGNL